MQTEEVTDNMSKKFDLSAQNHRYYLLLCPIVLLRMAEVSYDTKAYGFAQLPSVKELIFLLLIWCPVADTFIKMSLAVICALIFLISTQWTH